MMLLLAIIITVAVLGVVILKHLSAKNREKSSDEKAKLAAKAAEAVGQAKVDVDYFDRYLSNDSSHMDILFYVATCPDLIRLTSTVLKNVEEAKEKKAAALRGEDISGDKSKAENNEKKQTSFDIDDSGWADDDDDEDEQAKAAALKAKKAEEEREFQRKQLAAATGKLEKSQEDVLKVRFEGMDEGVLGQNWVESVLQKEGIWPPSPELITGLKVQRNYFEDDKGKKVLDPLDVPAVRRNVCMLMGRLHSQVLNSHPELVKAGPIGNLDGSYFRYSMDFRQRNGLLLEAALRMALANRSYQLAKTIIESICMFKIGTSSATEQKNVNWFNGVILQTYGGIEGLPRLKVSESLVETPGKAEIATGDVSVISLTISRTHAEKFTQHKLELCKKQNMDPRMALASYQEGWWVLVRAQNLSDENSEPALISAWPFLVRNIAQKAGKIKCKFQVPEKPGKYKFLFDIKSQDFLGADQSFEVETEILDRNQVDRDDDEVDDDDDEGVDGDGDDDGVDEDEAKKDK